MKSTYDQIVERDENQSFLQRLGVTDFYRQQKDRFDAAQSEAIRNFADYYGRERPTEESEEDDTEIFGVSLKETFKTLDQFPEGLTNGMLKAIAQTAASPNVFGDSLISQEDADYFTKMVEQKNKQRLPENFFHPASVLNLAGDITGNFLLPYFGARKKIIDWLGGAKSLTNRVVGTLAADFVVPALVMSPNDENLIGMLTKENVENSSLAKTMNDLFATNPEDPDYVNRMKNGAEGLLVLGLSEAFVRSAIQGVKQVHLALQTNIGKGIATAIGIGGAQPVIADEAEGGGVGQFVKQLLTRKEIIAINKTANRGTKRNVEIREEAERIKNEYPPEMGWSPLEIMVQKDGKAKIKVGKKDNKLKEVFFRQPAYEFHNPSTSTISQKQHKESMVNSTVEEVRDIANRALEGDQKAIDIISQANWYRAMRSRLRNEFGGMADVFADLLGATSAQTGVEQNFKNSVEVLRRFSRGEYDKEIAAYEKRLASGEPMGSKTLHQLNKADEFPLIRSAAGSLFNANSPAATESLLDMFRQIKQGSSPKTINFTGNLIGFSTDATIDVWAGRFLRRLSGRDRLPPPAEKAVAGKHLTGSTLENPRIGSEFAFGQKVFEEAANKINAEGFVKNIDSTIGDLGADDLQAVAWFLEKEKWTQGGWTTKAGEGGSLDFEANLAGATDPQRVTELRRTINQGFKKPNKLKKETEAEYAERVELLQRQHDNKISEAENKLATLEAPLQRTVLGVSAERPDNIPSNFRQAEVAAELDSVVRDDAEVVGYKLNSTFGRFMNEDERSLDAEFVTTKGFNPEKLTQKLVQLGKQYDQDSVFISHVVDPSHSNARPGIEIYFKNKVGMDVFNRVTKLLNERNIDGFTFITDSRQSDRVAVQTRAGSPDTAGLTGLRLQYIPEYDDSFNPSQRVEIMKKMRTYYNEIVNEISENFDGINSASVLDYDTTIFFKDNYDDYLGRFERSRGEVREGQQNSQTVPTERGRERSNSP